MNELDRVTILKNIATNGRTFCVLLCAICLAVYLDKREPSQISLAIMAAWPIGASYIAEALHVAGVERSGTILRMVFVCNVFTIASVIVSLWLI
jgi:hypothetical protein